MHIRTWIAAAAVWAFFGAAAAQEPPAQELTLAREIITLGKSVDMMNTMMGTMRPALIDQYRSQGLSQDAAERLVEIFLEEFADEHDAIIELAAIAYAERFTEQQLIDVRDFLASPSGRAWSDAAPEMTEAMSRAGMIIGEEVGVRAVRRFQQERERGRDPS